MDAGHELFFVFFVFHILAFDVWDHILFLKDWDKLPPNAQRNHRCQIMAAEMETRLRESVWTLSLDLYKYERFNLVSVLHILSCFVLEATHATGCN